MISEDQIRIRWDFLFLSAVYGLVFLFFYFHYVPLKTSFQTALIPILAVIFLLTAINIKWGILFFIFVFPLINNLPYFFGIAEPIPHAPTALVLFLVFFLGWLFHRSLFSSPFKVKEKIFIPLILFSLLVLVSGVITFFRSTNFYPFLSSGIYEYTTNVAGVTSGGALMSTVFFSLNYLTAFAFFFILISTVKSRSYVKKMLFLLCSSTLLSLSFGLFQYFYNIEIGNNPISIGFGLINGTFKNAISFGTYISVIVPLILGMIFAFKGLVRMISAGVVLLSLFMIFLAGSKSGLICLFISVVILMVLYISSIKSFEKIKAVYLKKAVIILGIVMVFIGTTIVFFQLSKEEKLPSRTVQRLTHTFKEGSLDKILRGRWDGLWKVAALMIKDYPLTGVGMGGYIIEAPNYAEVYKADFRLQSAENYFLQVGAELGLIGLFFALWIFWKIFKKIRQGYLKTAHNDKNRFIFIGAATGVLSYFLNILVHTYIGSYEIKYTFWFLVGLIFILAGDEKHKPKKKLFTKPLIISSLAVIALFTGLQLWNSTHSLSLEQRTEQFDLQQNFGFYDTEITPQGKEFRWTQKNAGITLEVKKPVLSIPLHASHPDIQEKPVKVKIFIIKDFFREKVLLDEIVLNKSTWETYEYKIPAEIKEEVILLFKVSRTWNPWKTTGALDTRNLGIALGEIKFLSHLLKTIKAHK